MWSEVKQTVKASFYSGGTITVTGTYNEVLLPTVQEVIWTPINTPVNQPVIKPRIANLHAGAAWMSDDFDAPLAEDFLLGDA